MITLTQTRKIAVRITVTSLLAGFVLARASAAQPEDANAEALHFSHGKPTTALSVIEAQIRSASSDQLRAIETRLLQVVQSSEATADAKSWACRLLRVAGSETSVPVLAPLLLNPNLAANAQFALRSIASPRVDEALRAALTKTDGLLKAGVVQTLGARGDREAVRLIAPLAVDTSGTVAEAALYALGQIGGADAWQAIEQANVTESLKAYREHALLAAAGTLPSNEAFAAYETLFKRAEKAPVKAAALRGMVTSDSRRSEGSLARALVSEVASLRAAAAKTLCEVADEALTARILNRFSDWSPDTQIRILGMISHPAALALAQRIPTDADVRLAALGAVGRLGNAANVPGLLAAAGEGGATQSAARKALQVLRGAGVDDALATAAAAGPLPQRVEAIRAQAARRAVNSVPKMLALATDAEPLVRGEAYQALALVAGPKDSPALVSLLVRSSTDSDRQGAEQALMALVPRSGQPEAMVASLLSELPAANSPTRCALLRVLAQAPCPASLGALRRYSRDTEPAVKNAAFRGLADWPDAAVAPDLLEIARTSDNAVHGALAFRNYVRLAGLVGKQDPAAGAQMAADAMKAAATPDDRKTVLALLPAIPSMPALNLAASCLGENAVEVEAATAVVSLARKLQAADTDAAAAAIQKILDVCRTPAARQLAENAGMILQGMINIAPLGRATSPDDLEKDGDSSGDQAAIDGNPQTYWDEADNAKLYRLLVTFPEPKTIAALSILGYAHHNYAPKDFEVVCDGQSRHSVRDAKYTDNLLVVSLPETTCQTVELRITGYYGGSPAIRELGIYQRSPDKTNAARVLVFSKTLGYRHANIPLGVAAIRQLGFEHQFKVDASEDSSVFTPANLARYKAVILLSATGDILNTAQEESLKTYLLGGGGFVGIHGALFGPSACEEQWAWYGELCCVTFRNHSAIVSAAVDVEDSTHPSTAGLPKRWQRTDEWYNFSGNPRSQARVLATVDETTYQGGTVGPDHPIAWCRTIGKGLMWYTAMGHADESFKDPLFLQHILGGIQFAAGLKAGNCQPNPKETR